MPLGPASAKTAVIPGAPSRESMRAKPVVGAGLTGDRTYLAIAYKRKAVETNKSVWHGKSSESKQFAASVLNAANSVAMLQGRAEAKRFCSHVPSALRFCALVEKSISFQSRPESK